MNNRSKSTEESRSKRKKGFAHGFNSVLNGRFLVRDYVIANLGFVFYLVGIMVAYIAYGYYSESNNKELVKTEMELRDIKAANLEMRSRLQQLKQRSRVAESIRDLGLVESRTPPKVIRVSPKNEDE
ncbi:MAG TPA: FtsL-like putative cell division protein [Cryomorphaceae bacterium]|nr:FtsL-like putative cell division protein [Cryomorphaceae bacterium]